jgi:hypothetical protein
MKKLFLFAVSTLLLASLSAQAQNVRVRGTITGVAGDTLLVKTREGKDVQIRLAPDAQVAVTKMGKLADFQPGSYIGVTSLKNSDGRLVARRVHALGPAVPQMHGAWDSIPDSFMTNANIAGTAQVSGGNELTLKYKDGEQKILVTPTTQYFTFAPGTRADLVPGVKIFTGARVEPDGKFSAARVTIGKDGVEPPQ